MHSCVFLPSNASALITDANAECAVFKPISATPLDVEDGG